MTKMKQATLFSLKKWNKITPEEILKHKDILDKENGSETIYLKSLAVLRERNPPKDLVLSTGLDSTLKRMLTRLHSLMVKTQVQNLVIQLKLDKEGQDLTDEKAKQPLVFGGLVTKNDSNNLKETIAISKKPEPLKNTENAVNNGSTTPAKDESKEISILKVCAKSVGKKEEIKSKPEEKKQEIKSNTSDQILKMQTEKKICKKPVVNELRKSEINRRLQSAMVQFMEELGKQEVKMYLDALAL